MFIIIIKDLHCGAALGNSLPPSRHQHVVFLHSLCPERVSCIFLNAVRAQRPQRFVLQALVLPDDACCMSAKSFLAGEHFGMHRAIVSVTIWRIVGIHAPNCVCLMSWEISKGYRNNQFFVRLWRRGKMKGICLRTWDRAGCFVYLFFLTAVAWRGPRQARLCKSLSVNALVVIVSKMFILTLNCIFFFSIERAFC